MKNLTLLILVASSLLFVSEANTKISERQHGLEMQGIVKQTGSDEYSSEYILDSALVSIYDQTKKTRTIQYSDNTGHCSIHLPFNNRFSISVSKNGYVTKIINIDTKVSGKHKKHFVFPFDIDLFKQIEGIDISHLLKDPIAFVNFNMNKKCFEYNYNYTDRVNGQIRKIYSEYYHSMVSTDFVKYDSVTETMVSVPPDNPPGQPIIPFYKSTVVYKVQIVAVVFGPLPDNHPVFSQCGKAQESYSEGLYKYTIGEFSDTLTAQKKMIDLKRKGYEDAFIVTFKNGIEIPPGNAELFLKE